MLHVARKHGNRLHHKTTLPQQETLQSRSVLVKPSPMLVNSGQTNNNISNHSGSHLQEQLWQPNRTHCIARVVKEHRRRGKHRGLVAH
jgi:hypothetical protein